MRILALALALCCPPAGAVSQTPDWNPYVVEDLIVHADGESGVAAKEAALEKAQAEALGMVFARIVPPQDRDRLAQPTPALGARLMDRITVLGERARPLEYRIRVRVAFDRGAVRRHLAARGVGYADEPAPAVLIVPVLERDGVPLLWDAAQEWHKALAAQDMRERLTPVRLPSNSSRDREERIPLLLSGDRISLDTLRVRYRTQGAVVARLSLEGGMARLRLNGFDAAGDLLHEEDVPPDLDAAASRVADLLSSRWRSALAGQSPAQGGGAGAGTPLAARVILRDGRDEWDGVRRRIEASGAVERLILEGLTGSGANVVIWPRRGSGDLADSLRRERLDLFESGGGWLLQPY